MPRRALLHLVHHIYQTWARTVLEECTPKAPEGIEVWIKVRRCVIRCFFTDIEAHVK